MLTALLLVLAASSAGFVGGALMGMRLGAEAMGRSMAAVIGGCFGLSATLPAALVAAALHLAAPGR